jgi:NADPH-dependent curcumin reductase CurA
MPQPLVTACVHPDDASNFRFPWLAAFKVGDKMPCGLVGEVIESKAAEFPIGCCIAGWANWEEYSVIASAGISKVRLLAHMLYLMCHICT